MDAFTFVYEFFSPVLFWKDYIIWTHLDLFLRTLFLIYSGRKRFEELHALNIVRIWVNTVKIPANAHQSFKVHNVVVQLERWLHLCFTSQGHRLNLEVTISATVNGEKTLGCSCCPPPVIGDIGAEWHADLFA